MLEITSIFSLDFITDSQVKIIKLKLYDMYCCQIKNQNQSRLTNNNITKSNLQA